MEHPDAARVTVPLLVGMTVREARNMGHHSGVVVTSADIDGPPTVVIEFEERHRRG